LFTTSNYNVIRLGSPYETLRKKLAKIKEKSAAKIVGFGDMTLEELAYNTGLPIHLAMLSQKREHDEPFRIVSGDKSQVLKAIKHEGLNCTEGGRYFHLTGNIDKGKAVSLLKNLYVQMFGKIKTFGVGSEATRRDAAVARLPLHLGHDYYWPVYEEAADLGCALGIHGGSSIGLGADTFTDPWAARVLRHPMPLALEFVSLVYHGVLDRYKDLRVGFFEGGCAWVLLLKDRMDRDDNVYTTSTGHARGLNDYLSSGQILVGCEGNEWILSYVIKQCGAHAFAYASDYPHEVDLVAAKEMIHDTVERPDLTHAEKAAVLGGNAKRFFRL
jgi:predicted TIM-barrel fold metal-dependent hydrolase